MGLLTDSEINHIKRCIGNAFRKILGDIQIRHIARQDPNLRTKLDLERAAKYLK